MQIRRIRKYRIGIGAAAAVVVALFLFGGVYYINHNHDNKALAACRVGGSNDRHPGHEGALLSLANGKSIILDTAHNGLLTTGFSKSTDGLRVTDGAQGNSVRSQDSAVLSYATLSTPAGRQQKLVLSDGTIAYLNAGSSITFPNVFSKDRRVTIMGEVYFEVVRDPKHPFIVKAGGDEICDLGTRFNVNAYADEPVIKTTLVEGSVRINGHYTLKPGDEFSGGQIKKVDADASIAWMSGFFHFDHDDITTVMRQVERWYDISVSYEGTKPTQKFGGDIQRNLMLSEVLELLGGTGIDYQLIGNKLIIKPK